MGSTASRNASCHMFGLGSTIKGLAIWTDNSVQYWTYRSVEEDRAQQCSCAGWTRASCYRTDGQDDLCGSGVCLPFGMSDETGVSRSDRIICVTI